MISPESSPEISSDDLVMYFTVESSVYAAAELEAENAIAKLNELGTGELAVELTPGNTTEQIIVHIFGKFILNKKG